MSKLLMPKAITYFLMLSEKHYWIVLILALGLFSIADWFMVVPLERDLGIDLFTNAIFTIFTVIFLTWIIRSRETSRWKLVENHVRKRIADKLQLGARDICGYFLGNQGYDYVKKKAGAMSPHRVWTEAIEVRHGILSETAGSRYSALIEYFTGRDSIKLRADSCFLEDIRDRNLVRLESIVNSMTANAEFFEHAASEYSGFLSPRLVEAMMKIQDGLNRIIAECNEVMLFVKEKREPSPSPIELALVQNGIHEVIKEMDQLNKLNLGFYPRPYKTTKEARIPQT